MIKKLLLMCIFASATCDLTAETKSIMVECAEQNTSCAAYFGGKEYSVHIGMDGLESNKNKSNHTTPVGEFNLGNTILYRADKVKIDGKVSSGFSIINITDASGRYTDEGVKKLKGVVSNIDHIKSSDIISKQDNDSIYDIIIPVAHEGLQFLTGKNSGMSIHTYSDIKKNLENDIGVSFSQRDFLEILPNISPKTKIILQHKK